MKFDFGNANDEQKKAIQKGLLITITITESPVLSMIQNHVYG